MIPTAHISASKDDLAETIIMPGDPLRSQMIANTFLENPVLVNNVRGVQGYTGYYNGKKITVMASGMGNPSMGIYSYELQSNYKTIILIIANSNIYCKIKPLNPNLIALLNTAQYGYPFTPIVRINAKCIYHCSPILAPINTNLCNNTS